MALFDTRKGITPLVATFLLVAFSIGLGAIVMQWGEQYISERAEFVQGTAEVRSACDSAKISVINIAGQPQSCVSAQGVEVWLDNGPDVDILNIHARIAGKTGLDVKEDVLLAPLLKSNAARAVVPLKKEIGEPLQVKLTPKILDGRKVATCAQSAIEIDRFTPCSG